MLPHAGAEMQNSVSVSTSAANTGAAQVHWRSMRPPLSSVAPELLTAEEEAARKKAAEKAAKKAGGPGFGRSPKGGTPAGKTPSGSGPIVSKVYPSDEPEASAATAAAKRAEAARVARAEQAAATVCESETVVAVARLIGVPRAEDLLVGFARRASSHEQCEN